MTLPSSGQISFSDVNTELGRGSTDEMSLSDAEGGVYAPINQNSTDKPDGIAPNSMSEWYGYDHNAGPALTQGMWYDTGFTYGSGPTACSVFPPGAPTDIWYSGTGGVGDVIYYDDQGATPFFGFNQYQVFDLDQPNVAALVDNSGIIQDIYVC